MSRRGRRAAVRANSRRGEIVDVRSGAGRMGPALLAAALIGFAITLYLVAERLAGVPLVCGPFGGCDVVQASRYSDVGGVPVAVLGAAGSAILLAAAIGWWRWRDARLLAIVYVGALASVAVVVYFTALELVVIHAVCSWCAAYAIATATLAAVAGLVLRRTR